MTSGTTEQDTATEATIPATSTATSVMPGAETTNARTTDIDAAGAVDTLPPQPVALPTATATATDADVDVDAPASLGELQAVIQKKYGLEPDALDPDRPMGELGLDSLAIAEFLFEVEDHFAIRLIDDDPSVDTLRKLAVVVDKSIAAKAAKEAAAAPSA